MRDSNNGRKNGFDLKIIDAHDNCPVCPLFYYN